MKSIIKPLLITFLLFCNSKIFSQDFNPFDPGADPGVAPINDYIIPMLVVGIVLSFFLHKKKKIAK